MAVLIDKSGNIVATHLIKIKGHYDPKRWDKDKVVESYTHLWMMTNEIIRQNGLFVDEIDVAENNFEEGMYPIIGHR
jgi:hypothetical protein